MSWLPVPHRPEVRQVSWMVTSVAGNRARIVSGVPCALLRGWPSSMTRQPPQIQSETCEPLPNGQRPVTR
jgi:hypothetical protein